MAEPVLVAEKLTRAFRGFVAVRDVSLSVQAGTVHALIGPNGAGKTTCFNLLSRFLDPSGGTIRFEGADITHRSPAQVARLGLVRSFQISAVFGALTALDNVRLALMRAAGERCDPWRPDRVLRRHDERAHDLLREVGLADCADIRAAALSYGRKRALELATTLALDPRLMLLDEPTAGMTQEDVGRIVALLRRLRGSRTILMVEHNLEVVRALCDRITVLVRGQVLAEGDYAAIAADPAVRAAYLGAAHG